MVIYWVFISTSEIGTVFSNVNESQDVKIMICLWLNFSMVTARGLNLEAEDNFLPGAKIY